MHNALLISEVLSSVVDYLAEDTVRSPKYFQYARDTRKAGRRSLAVLARTCRAFSELALNALWRRLHNLTPIVLCLPTRDSQHGMTTNGALPPFNEEEWDIVLRYAPRVRELTVECEPLSLKILQSLWFRTSLLLPNLRKLHWSYYDDSAIASIRLLLSPSLVYLRVGFGDGDHSSVLGFFECCPTLCPNLKSLYLGPASRFPHVTAAVSRAISRFPNLETLSFYSIDTLRGPTGYGTPDHPPFKNLRVLQIFLEDLSSITPYLKSHHQPFEEVVFRFRILPAPEVFHQFFTALSSVTRRGTLRRIGLLSIGQKRHGIALQSVDFQVLSTLMTFNLHEFDMELHNPVSLNDDELARLVQAWPELEAFNFNQQHGWDHLPPLQIPTLKGLLRLLVRCPKLRELEMCIDARNIPSLSEEESLVRNMAITKLSLGNSIIQEPVASVAQLLLEHFPSLIALREWFPASEFIAGEPPDDYRYMWREVNTLIQEVSGRGPSPEASDND